MLDCEEDAAELRSRGEPTGFGMRDWTYERELLSTLIDEVRSMHATLYTAHGGKDFPFTPTPRPRTALDRIERRERYARHEQRIKLVLPDM